MTFENEPYDFNDPFDFDDGATLLQGLNEAQCEAVTHKDGPMLVLAGPGSGKTRVVTHRIAWLLRNGVRASEIAALTFTNKAADEMKKRVEVLAPGQRVWIGTFHRFCAYLLRFYASYVGLSENYTIYDADESKKLLEEIAPKKILPQGVDVPKIASAISAAKNKLISADEYLGQPHNQVGRIVEDVYPAYQSALRRANAVDFDDLLFHVATLLKEQPEIRSQLDSRFRYILIDEYQDTNLAQYVIARALSIDYPNLAVTGDPDQSIYGWRGANIQNILNFEKDFDNVKVVRLEQNYRSAKSVLRVADAVIKHNKIRKEKKLFTENQEGLAPRIIVALDQTEEAEQIAAEIAAEIAAGKRSPKDYAIFYRMNALSRNLEYALRLHGVPFQLVRGLEFFARKEIKDLCSYLQVAYNTNNVVAFKRIVNLPPRGIGKTTVDRLEEFAKQRAISLFDAARDAKNVQGLTKKAVKSLANFVALIDNLRDQLSSDVDLEVVLSYLVNEIKYYDYLSASNSEEDEQRRANVQEFLSEAREFDADFEQMERETAPSANSDGFEFKRDRLGCFLEQLALVNDVDSWNSQDDRVSLMSLHAAKGLEFPVVYIIALEDGTLPHERSVRDRIKLEEERRLFFVGITRAKEELRVSRTRFRLFRGASYPAITSRFLFEIPQNEIDRFDSVEEWIRERQKEAERDSSVVVPTLLERKEGVSQRQELWERETQKEQSDANWDSSVPVSRKQNVFQPDIEYVDPEPDDDYSQIGQDDDSYVDDDGYVRTNANRNLQDDAGDSYDEFKAPFTSRAKASRKPPRKIDPTAITTAASLNGDDSKPHRSLNADVTPGSFVKHKNFGVGVVQKVNGPKIDRILTIKFLSGVGKMELSIFDPDLELISFRPIQK